jgi:hypothetical protein
MAVIGALPDWAIGGAARHAITATKVASPVDRLGVSH